jgi:transcriptional regulator with XRE-family HTH domain
MTQEALARAAHAHIETIQKFEAGRPATFPIKSKIRAALEAAGVEFTTEVASGVKRKPQGAIAAGP